MSRSQTALLVAVALVAGGSGAFAQDGDHPQMPSMFQAPLEKSRTAIAECREKRLRGEISSYAESARCSNRIIFVAWKEAGYPDMDLITQWLTAREAASEKVDQKVMAPKEFERQMGEITMRLTAEEQRRRAGLIYAADGALRLELPSSTQVLGVATPANEQKQAAKRSAAARTRAASGEYVDPAKGTSVGAMGSLSPLDSSKPSSGVGGPFVPVNPNSPAARAALARAAPGEGSNGLYALLASQQSEADARAIYRMLQGKYPDILGNRAAVIRRADAGGQGTYYRVEVGPLTTAQADQMCSSIKQAGGQCMQHYE